MEDTERAEKIPEIKYEQVGEPTVEEIDLGNGQTVEEETYTQKEIEATNLKKIAPMYYFCSDNNKVYFIPFSIQFSLSEALKNLATTAVNLQEVVAELNKKDEEKH